MMEPVIVSSRGVFSVGPPVCEGCRGVIEDTADINFDLCEKCLAKEPRCDVCHKKVAIIENKSGKLWCEDCYLRE